MWRQEERALINSVDAFGQGCSMFCIARRAVKLNARDVKGCNSALIAALRDE